MRILGRLTLLSLFAATGVALAVYVGSATSPSPARRAAAGPIGKPSLEERDKIVEVGDRGAAAPEREPSKSAPQQVVDRASSYPAVKETSPHADLGAPEPGDDASVADSVHPPLTMPTAAALAEPYPARTFQVGADTPSPNPLKSFGFWKALASPLLRQVARAPQPRIDVTAPDAEAAGGPLSMPAHARLARSGAGAASDGALSGEGDGELSMQVPDNDIREVLDALSVQGNLNILATESVQGKVSASLSGVDVESALDAILKATGYVAKRDGDFIYVGKPEDFDDLEKSLDTVGTRVYRPNYVTAAELQALIQPLVTEGSGVVAVSSPAEMGIGADAADAGGDGFAGGEVVVVRDYRAVLAEVDQVVAEIDVRPMQVAIETMILSVKLTDTDKLGINWDLLRQKDNLSFVIGTPPQTLPTKFTTGGLAVAFMDSNLGAFLDALEELNETNVIATPRLMVINKHRAEIQIGRQQGYISSTVQTETSTSGSMEMLDTGTILRLRPFISADGLIRMEVHPELSTGEVVLKGTDLVPDKELTQVTTNIMVRDGCTVIIGGLMREELTTSGNQVPYLGNLPWVGPLFRNRDEITERHEILVLITPHIVYEPATCEEGQNAACEFHRRQDVYREKMSLLGKRHVARKYFRMAQNAWASGDRPTALRFAELSVHFDPLNRAAIDLRSDIWLGHPEGDHTLAAPSAAVSPTAPLDGSVIDPWLLEQLQREPIPLPGPVAPVHPLDRGQPGHRRDIERPRSFQ